jgi:hypothetical protein
MELESTAGVKELRSMWEFASIYSFFNEFRDTLELTGFSIEDLEQAIQVNPKDSPLMQDIWIKLLLQISRKKASLINPDTWEATLRTAINQHQSAYWLTNPLKICEYKRLPLRKRVFILKSVIDWVLEDSEMLQRYIDRQKTDKMRYSPLGTDANGSIFWYLNDYRLYKETKVSEEEAQKRRDERRTKDKQDREMMKRAADDKKRREEEKRQANVKARPREFYVPIVEEVKIEKKENTTESVNANAENITNQPADSTIESANANGTSDVNNENNTNQAEKMEVEQSLVTGDGETAVKDDKQNNNNEDKEEDKPEGELKQNNNDDDADVGITYEDEQIVEESDEMKEEDLHTWELVCRNTTEWGNFVEQFKQSKHAGEREIAAFIAKNIIEHISTKMQAYLHAKRRTHLLPIQHRKKSTRLQMKEIQKIEQRVTRSGGRRKEKDVKVSREDRLEARRHRRDVNLAKALASPSNEEQSETSALVVDENGNPIEQPPQDQSPTVVKPPRPKPPPRPKGPRKSLAEELLELEQEEGPLSDDDESEDDDDFDGGEKPRRRASTGAFDAGRGRGPRNSLSPTAGRPRGPRQHKSNFETELVPTAGATFVSSRGRQVKTRMWNDQDAEDDFEERISSSPAPRPKSVKQNHPRVNPDSTLNLKLKLSFIKETLGEEGFAKATTPKARVGRPPKSAATPKKEKQQEDFVPPSEEEEFEDDDEEEEYEDEEDEDFDVGSSKRRKSGGSAGKNSRRGSSAHNTTVSPFVPQAFNNTNSINSTINSQRVGMTNSLDSMQSNISNLLTNISATPAVGAYKPPLIFGNTVSPTDINWNFVTPPKSAAPVNVSTYNIPQTPLVVDNNVLKRTSAQMDANNAAYGFQQEGQPQHKRQRLDEAELLMGLLPSGAPRPTAVNMSPSVTSNPQQVSAMQNTYSAQQQQPLSYPQNPFAQVSSPVFSTQSVMNFNNVPLMASTSSLNNSQPINLFTSDELPQSVQASQVSANNSQDIDQFLNLGPDSDNK